MKKRIWLCGVIILLSLLVSMNAWAYVGATMWQGLYSTSVKISSMDNDAKGNVKYYTSNMPFSGTITLYTEVGGGPAPNSPDGCYLTLSGAYNTFVCIDDIVIIVTDKYPNGKKHNETAILIGSGWFDTDYNGYHNGMCSVDLKATLVEDAGDYVTSMKVSGKIAGGESMEASGGYLTWYGFVMRGNLTSTLLPH